MTALKVPAGRRTRRPRRSCLEEADGAQGRTQTFRRFKQIRAKVGKQSAGRVIARNSIWLGLGQGAAGIVNVGLATYLGRRFGAEGYGRFAFALSYALLFSTLFDFGLTTVVTREVARDHNERTALAQVLALKVCIGLGALAALSGSSALFVKNSATEELVVLLGVYVFLMALANHYYAAFRAQQRMDREARYRLLQVALLISLLVGSGLLRGPLPMIAGSFAISTAATLAVISVISARSGILAERTGSLYSSTTWRRYAAAGWYLALGEGLGTIITYLDTVLLGAFALIQEAGWYNAAGRVNGLLLFPLPLVATAMLPSLVSTVRTSTERFLAHWTLWLRCSLWLSGLLVAVVWTTADRIILTLFPVGFAPAIWALRILVLGTVFQYVNMTYLQVLFVFDRQRQVFQAMGAAALLNIGLNLILIPHWGLYAASWTTDAAYLVVLGYFLWCARSLPFRVRGSVVGITVAQCLVAGTMTWVQIVLLEQVLRVQPIVTWTAATIWYGAWIAALEWLARRLGGTSPAPTADYEKPRLQPNP